MVGSKSWKEERLLSGEQTSCILFSVLYGLKKSLYRRCDARAICGPRQMPRCGSSLLECGTCSCLPPHHHLPGTLRHRQLRVHKMLL
ncbi:hypothetical protein J6590_038239 [Homalodisca vitripennis]|nr:hypothetical protein J6590_038239 [Homalodisca vitripennis]